jgi:hypothetical protein
MKQFQYPNQSMLLMEPAKGEFIKLSGFPGPQKL